MPLSDDAPIYYSAVFFHDKRLCIRLVKAFSTCFHSAKVSFGTKCYVIVNLIIKG